MSETVIYELHVKGFTRLHPSVPEHLRGTYAGLAYPAVIQHLIGSRASLPSSCCQYTITFPNPSWSDAACPTTGDTTPSATSHPHAAYGSVGTLGQQVREFKEMVSALHEAGIEVILDVVYNHTGEGGHEGPTLSFRGIDHLGYYRLTDDQRNDYDVTGCGNSVDTSEPGVLRMVLDSLRYWVTEMGVDGFRFDLVSTLIRDERHHVDQDHPFKQCDPRRPRAEPGQDHRRALGHGPVRLPGRRIRTRAGANGTTASATMSVTSGAATPTESASLAQRLTGSPDIFDRERQADHVEHQLRHRPRRLHHARPGHLQRQAQRCQRRVQPRRLRRQSIMELWRRGRDRRSGDQRSSAPAKRKT